MAAAGRRASCCHTYGRSAKTSRQMIPGWPYCIVAALKPAAPPGLRCCTPSGWSRAPVGATQLRQVVERLIAVGHHRAGDPAILIVLDAGHDMPRMAGLPEEVPGRMRCAARLPPARSSTGPIPTAAVTPSTAPSSSSEIPLPGMNPTPRRSPTPPATAMAWTGYTRSRGIRPPGRTSPATLPIMEGTVIRLQVGHLSSGGDPGPLWLWWVRAARGAHTRHGRPLAPTPPRNASAARRSHSARPLR
ncbi:transposase [Nonomuraea monospora]|uniref:transposase n=1 Tax=Nonomuraea monospora TaxID=568818 RepID=UPI003CD089DD